ncbi:MAG TPA: glycosyltransferase family 2 protein [Jatrophihabitantaceae bacterium]|jgi:cellulose synthase/poly-beta-1,6-N-acetylglucosamine synthase-like glycosyltransferase
MSVTQLAPARAETVDDLELALLTLPAAARGRVVAVIPAHNEEASIALALDSLVAQERRPDLVVVVGDNCTDGTAAVVNARGDAVMTASVANPHKKAGALNQALDRILPALEDDDAVLVMDADSALDPLFVAVAAHRLGTRTGRGRHGAVIGGVGGTFRGGRGGGFVGLLQRNEYARYARDVRRLCGRVLVLTGTAALFRVGVLRAVIAARATGELPGGSAQVYDTHVLTEDNELTLALLHLGYAIISPRECLLETEVMTSWRALWAQRLRWKRGALENLVDYGWTPVTARYWGRQLVTHIGVLVTIVYLATVAWALLATGTVHLHPIWMAVTGVFVAERIVSVRERGPLQMLLASVLVVEMAFDVFLQGVQLRAFWDTVTRRERRW